MWKVGYHGFLFNLAAKTEQNPKIDVQLAQGAGRIFPPRSQAAHAPGWVPLINSTGKSGPNRPKILSRHFQRHIPGSPTRRAERAVGDVPPSPLSCKGHPTVPTCRWVFLACPWSPYSFPRSCFRPCPPSRRQLNSIPHKAAATSQPAAPGSHPATHKRDLFPLPASSFYFFRLKTFPVRITSGSHPSCSPIPALPASPRPRSCQVRPQKQPPSGLVSPNFLVSPALGWWWGDKGEEESRMALPRRVAQPLKKAEASLAKKPALGSPDEPQTSLPTILSNNLSQPRWGSSSPTPQPAQRSPAPGKAGGLFLHPAAGAY